MTRLDELEALLTGDPLEDELLSTTEVRKDVLLKLIAVARAAAAFIHAEEHEGPIRSVVEWQRKCMVAKIGAREIAVALAALEEP